MSESPLRTVVIGLGSLLMEDDGLGPAVIEALGDLPGVEQIDGGVAGLSLIGWMEEADRVILVDAARMGAEPGTIRLFRPDQVRSRKPVERFSLHGMDLLAVLALGREIGVDPDVTVVAVEPFSVGPKDRLSEPMAQRLPAVVQRTREVALAKFAGAVGMEDVPW